MIPPDTKERPPRRKRGGVDAPISDFKAAIAALPQTILRGTCPNCRKAYMYRDWIRLKDVCDFCGVRFERDTGSFLMLLAFNYLVAVLSTGLVAWVLIARYGFFDGLTWILVGVGLLSLVAFYHATKSLYVWVLWAFGFVYND